MKKNSKSKIKSNSPLPLYFQIKEDLKSKIENGILNGSKHKTKPHALRLQNEHSILKMLYHGFIKRKRQTRTQTKCKVLAIRHL